MVGNGRPHPAPENSVFIYSAWGYYTFSVLSSDWKTIANKAAWRQVTSDRRHVTTLRQHDPAPPGRQGRQGEGVDEGLTSSATRTTSEHWWSAWAMRMKVSKAEQITEASELKIGIPTVDDSIPVRRHRIFKTTTGRLLGYFRHTTTMPPRPGSPTNMV